MNSLKVDPNHNRDWRLTLDTKDDYKVITKFTDHMLKKGKLDNYRLQDIVEFFNKKSVSIRSVQHDGFPLSNPPAFVVAQVKAKDKASHLSGPAD